MKEVQIIIRPNQYYKTKDKLIEKGFYCMSVKEILGRGKHAGSYEAAEGGDGLKAVGMDFVAKKFLDIYVADRDVDALIAAVLEVNSTGTPGDGKIFVLPADDAVRIRTHQSGDDAIF